MLSPKVTLTILSSPFAGAGPRATAFPEARGGRSGSERRTTCLRACSRGEVSTSTSCSLRSSSKGGRAGNSGKTAATSIQRTRRRQGCAPDKLRQSEQASKSGSAGGEGQLPSALFTVVCDPYNVASVSNGLPTLGALGAHPPEGPMEAEPYLVVFSGGTAFNSVAGTVRGGYHLEA